MKIGFLEFIGKLLGPKGIFSDAAEGHAWLIGWSETLAFWRPRYPMPLDYTANGSPLKEFHYYMFGRACGIIFWLWCIVPLFVIIVRAVV